MEQNDLMDIERAILNEKEYFKITKPSKLWYIIPTILIIISIGLPLVIYLTKISAVLLFISVIMGVPILLVSSLVLIGRLINQKQIIYNKITPKITNNYIIANFFKENKGIDKKVCILNRDGISFNIGEALYMIDLKAIWKENGKPNAFYLPNLPNPLVFEFQDNIQGFIKQLLMSKTETPTETIYYDKQGKLVDVSYSSENLQLFKKDKMFAELHRNGEEIKLIMAMIGVIALAFVAIIIMAMFRKSEVIVQQTPAVVKQSLMLIMFMVVKCKKN